MAIMADFARMPTNRKVMVFFVIGAALFGVYFQLAFKSLNESVDRAQADHDSKVATNKRMAEKDLPDFEELKKKMGRLKRIIDDNQKALPTEAELPAFFETLNRKVTESGVQVTKWQQQPEEPIETFVKVPVEVELTGTFMEIKKFFASLVPKKLKGAPVDGSDEQREEHERIVSIENLSLANPVVKNREIVLTAKFIAATYRQEDKQPEPAGKPGAAKPGAPLPPANTPAGAKARTEGAIDKGDKKDRNAAGVNEAKTPSGSGAQKLKGGI